MARWGLGRRGIGRRRGRGPRLTAPSPAPAGPAWQRPHPRHRGQALGGRRQGLPSGRGPGAASVLVAPRRWAAGPPGGLAGGLAGGFGIGGGGRRSPVAAVAAVAAVTSVPAVPGGGLGGRRRCGLGWRLGRWRLGRWRLGAGARLWGAVSAGGAVAFVVPPSAVQWAAAAARAIPGRDLQRERGRRGYAALFTKARWLRTTR